MERRGTRTARAFGIARRPPPQASGVRVRVGRRLFAATLAAVALVVVATLQAGAATVMITVAGSGTSAYSGDGGYAYSTEVDAPDAVATDSSGDVFIADTANNRVRMIPATSGTFYGIAMTAGSIYTIAGTGTACSTHTVAGCDYSGAATSALLDAPSQVAVDSSGNVYIADTSDNMIAMIPKASGTHFGIAMTANDLYAIAGNGTAGTCSGTAATGACVDAAAGIYLDSSGNLIIANTAGNKISMVPIVTGTYFDVAMSTADDMYTVAGNGTAGTCSAAASTGACVDAAQGVTEDSAGNLIIANTAGNKVSAIAKTAGNATFNVTLTSAADMYTIAGNGTAGTCSAAAATGACVDLADGVTIDSGGNLLIDNTSGNKVSAIPKTAGNATFGVTLTTAGDMYTIAGSGTAGNCANGVAATGNCIDASHKISIDGSGNLYVANTSGSEIAMLPKVTGTYFGVSETTANDVYTIAGNATAGYLGDGGFSSSTSLLTTQGLFIDSNGNLYIAGSSANRVRMIPASSGTYFGIAMTAGHIYTIAGNGTAGTCSAAVATGACVDGAQGVYVDSSGNLYIAQTAGNVVSMIPAASGTYFGVTMSTAGDMYTVAGDGTAGTCNAASATGTGPMGACVDAADSVTLDAAGDLLIAQTGGNVVSAIPKTAGNSVYGVTMSTAGDMYTVAGDGTAGTCSAAKATGTGPAGACVDAAQGIYVDSHGNLLIAQTGKSEISAIPSTAGNAIFGVTMSTAGDMYTIAGNGTAGKCTNGSAPTGACIDAADAITEDSSGNLLIANTTAEEISGIPGTTAGTYYGVAMSTLDKIYILAGTGTACTPVTGACGDGGAATSATIDNPQSIAAYGGNIYFADSATYRIREIVTTPFETAYATTIAFPGDTLSGVDQTVSSVLAAQIIPQTTTGEQYQISATTFTNGAFTFPVSALVIPSFPVSECETGFSCVRVAPYSGAVSYPLTVTTAASSPSSFTFLADDVGEIPQVISIPFNLTIPANAHTGTYSSTWTISSITGP